MVGSGHARGWRPDAPGARRSLPRRPCRQPRGASSRRSTRCPGLGTWPGPAPHPVRGLDGLVVDDAGHQRATLVVDDVGLDAGGRGVLGGVEVGAEHEHGGVLGALGGGQSAGHVGMLINLHINAANGTQLFSHDLGHLVLSGRRGRLRLVVRVGLGIYLHVAHEALDDVTHGASWRCAHGRAARPPAPGAGLVWVRFYSRRARPR